MKMVYISESVRDALRNLLSKTTSDEYDRVYEIITALRGPDHTIERSFLKQEKLKSLSTSRLRAIIGFDDSDAFMMVRMSPLTDDEVKERNKLLSKCDHHFRDHFIDAIISASLLGYDVPENELRFDI